MSTAEAMKWRPAPSRVPLSRREEARLAQRTATGDLDAKRRLVEANLGLVIAIVRRYRGRGVEQQDLVQEGTLGLIRAIGKFDRRRGVRLSTYASWWIRQAVERAILEQGRTIRLPASAAEQLRWVDKARRELAARFGHFPNDDELAGRTGIKRERLAELRAAEVTPASLDDVEQHGAEIPAEDANPDQAIGMEPLLRTLRDALAELPDPRQRRVLELHYGLGAGRAKTLKEIGELLGLTPARICQLEKRALEALRSAPAADDWHAVLAA